MRGYYGIGVYHPKYEENIGTLWRASFLYEANFLFTVGKRYSKQPTDTPDTTKHVPLFQFDDFNQFKTSIPSNVEIICIELDEKSLPLSTFIHPERAIYLLGAEDYGVPKEITKHCRTVQIPTIKPWSMNVAMAGSIVLYDRYVKMQD